MNSLHNNNEFQPLVSIVIPVYNGSNYLAEAIDSALAQTYEHVEVLVVNDGSNDGGKTRDIALKYGNKIRYFEKENGGVSTALNHGIREMHGDFFSWLSHDDLYHQKNIEIQIHNIIKAGDMCVSGCLTSAFKQSPRETNRPISAAKRYILSEHLDFWNHWIYACALLIPKSVLKVIGGLNKMNKTAQDDELVWDILSLTQIHLLDCILVFRRSHYEQGMQNPALLEINLADGEDLLRRKISKHGVEYFSGKDASARKKSYVLFYLSIRFMGDKRRQVWHNYSFFRWLLGLSYKLYPYPWNPAWLANKTPFGLLFLYINSTNNVSRYAGVMKRALLNGLRLSHPLRRSKVKR